MEQEIRDKCDNNDIYKFKPKIQWNKVCALNAKTSQCKNIQHAQVMRAYAALKCVVWLNEAIELGNGE